MGPHVEVSWRRGKARRKRATAVNLNACSPETQIAVEVDPSVNFAAATVTVLETVANGATLLATQSFEKVNEEWVLKSHYTIPYGKDTVAKIALRCDERGCVAVPSKAVASQN